ncbi:MAG TPA: hypothetical protein VE133_02685, partial [Candidatus Sulfotelmatobacter sp.]|nr:hypothetical protein [Candidatus Sulfotelmatobacter sp.]
MNRSKIVALFVFVMIAAIMTAGQQEELPVELKDAALHDAACSRTGENQQSPAENLSALRIHAGARELGTIVTVQGACHCQNDNCDALVYLRTSQGYRLALHEKYASLHPMKIVKRGMPSLTGQFEINAVRMETTVYDWDGKDYRPSLCATVIKGKKVPSIARHP